MKYNITQEILKKVETNTICCFFYKQKTAKSICKSKLLKISLILLAFLHMH